MPQDGPRMPPRWRQDPSKWPQQAYKKRPSDPKMEPRPLRDGSGTLKASPKPGPKVLQDPPKTPQDAPKASKNNGFSDPNMLKQAPQNRILFSIAEIIFSIICNRFWRK